MTVQSETLDDPENQLSPTTEAVIESTVNAGPNTGKLSVENLDFFYGDFKALSNISLAVLPHEITALIGPSGCGKSTFLRIFNRMNDEIHGARVTGRACLDGEDIYAKGVDVAVLRKRIGMVFQRANPFPKSIFENVVYGPRIHGERDKAELANIAEKSLRSAVLWDEVKDKLHASAFELSGGQQQRLCIARSLAVEPEVLLMDEPTSALDPNATFRIEELMSALKKEYTVVIVTHNMQQAARIADRTAFFLMGEVIEYGQTGDLFSRPVDRRTEDYISGRFG